MGHYISHNFPPKPTWSFDKIPDLTGQVIIVTGSNTGIGKVVAEQLLKHNAKVYMAVRSQEKAEAAIKDLKEKTGKEAIFLKLDLNDLTTIKPSVEEFLRKETKLHVLINNAGVASPPIDQVTAQGFDLQFGVNTLGPFFFTKLLLPILTSTAETTPNKHVRVVHVSSYAHHFFPKLDFNTFKDGPARRKMQGMLLYGQSKTGNILFSNELAKRYGEKGIVSISLHPGSVRSELGRHGPELVMRFIHWALFYPEEFGGLGPLYAATAPECDEYNGKYLTAWARYDAEEPNPKVRDPDLAKELWEYMEEQVRDYCT
ncbi:hypothetical protein GYMLUDRAFT_47987 [Collybiopsis luxurians FD-317 M1]|uniref:NAD(P)-binding protein n=1 Tax=Collybiopsis luxurians FD-317 M1 TaxID=944289 RepID=A0A0D0CJP0_9AGAR|nr:hypothetical protein GYMLUDRAFT_47987 [Collybiopsis luxurians FD-317 M1]